MHCKLIDKNRKDWTSPNIPIPRCNLVLGVDEALIHCIVPEKLHDIPDIMTRPCYATQFIIDNIVHMIFVRPYVIKFLLFMKNYCDMYLYTNGTEEYASLVDGMLNNILFSHLAPDNGRVDRIFKKTFCVDIHSNSKEQNKLEKINLDPKKTIIIDDREDLWTFDKNNLYLIQQFNVNDENINYVKDKELLNLSVDVWHIIKMYEEECFSHIDFDIRDIIKEWKLKHKTSSGMSPIKVVEQKFGSPRVLASTGSHENSVSPVKTQPKPLVNPPKINTEIAQLSRSEILSVSPIVAQIGLKQSSSHPILSKMPSLKNHPVDKITVSLDVDKKLGCDKPPLERKPGGETKQDFGSAVWTGDKPPELERKLSSEKDQTVVGRFQVLECEENL